MENVYYTNELYCNFDLMLDILLKRFNKVEFTEITESSFVFTVWAGDRTGSDMEIIATSILADASIKIRFYLKTIENELINYIQVQQDDSQQICCDVCGAIHPINTKCGNCGSANGLIIKARSGNN